MDSRRFAMRLSAVLLASGLLPSLVSAQEIERSRPWSEMSGRNAGAVGTCPDVDGGEGDTCYIVRCQPKLGLVFVIQHDGIADDDVRSVRIEIGKYKGVIALEAGAADERFTRLADHPDLLKAMTSGRKWAELQTVDAKFQYTTEFELTRAKARIGHVAKQCKA